MPDITAASMHPASRPQAVQSPAIVMFVDRSVERRDAAGERAGQGQGVAVGALEVRLHVPVDLEQACGPSPSEGMRPDVSHLPAEQRVQIEPPTLPPPERRARADRPRALSILQLRDHRARAAPRRSRPRSGRRRTSSARIDGRVRRAACASCPPRCRRRCRARSAVTGPRYQPRPSVSSLSQTCACLVATVFTSVAHPGPLPRQRPPRSARQARATCLDPGREDHRFVVLPDLQDPRRPAPSPRPRTCRRPQPASSRGRPGRLRSAGPAPASRPAS